MKIQFNPPVANPSSSAETTVINPPLPQTWSSSSTLSKKEWCQSWRQYISDRKMTLADILELTKGLFLSVFRFATYPLQLLFVKTPKLNGFFIPDITTEKKQEYEKMLSENGVSRGWILLSQSGPSWDQKIQLLHQCCSFWNHLKEWNDGVKNGLASGTIIINKSKVGIGLSPPYTEERKKHFFISACVKEITQAKRGENTPFVLHFEDTCCINYGYGPYRIVNSTLTVENTLHSDGTTTINPTKKRIKNYKIFFNFP